MEAGDCGVWFLLTVFPLSSCETRLVFGLFPACFCSNFWMIIQNASLWEKKMWALSRWSQTTYSSMRRLWCWWARMHDMGGQWGRLADSPTSPRLPSPLSHMVIILLSNYSILHVGIETLWSYSTHFSLLKSISSILRWDQHINIIMIWDPYVSWVFQQK